MGVRFSTPARSASSTRVRDPRTVRETRDGLLGVTNRHVHDSCVKALADGPQVTCQIGGASFDPAARLIDRSEHYDLVTYDISEVQTNGADADIHYAPTWPPAVDPEGLVIVGGWLNAFRAEGENETTHSFLHFYAYTDRSGTFLKNTSAS